ncbi:DNA polymerase III subunit delta' [Microbispora triticiradicis]|uniref:DNA polymerase III subunit delta' n=1 Tax=Microbispora triticiradicis TaxID=2200763 RepID=A0ABX9LR21_9ACTN|nr:MULTISPECIES: DNA polymerase III subunit delta' [Microbispora]RGA06350.1 DNA polymerase III subunit delta' [Microbispora triticiradicis]GLW25046.1 DNA polymerase III subunit delta [Microbispora amethystogenes]
MTVYGDLIGQDRAIGVLRRAASAAAEAVAGGRGAGMTHAWLFTGPPGSGRSTAAKAFAAALLCPEQGCGHCDACHQVEVGSHPDVTFVRPEGLSYGVRQTRELVLKAAGAPTLGRWRVVLFEDADRVTEQAANALLKAIEEPPPRTVWLLCAPSADDMIITIRSRCRVVTLGTPSTEAVANVLATRDGVPHDVALDAARAAQGDVGRARRLALDEETRRRRAEVLSIPRSLTGVAECVTAAERLVKTSTEDADAATTALNEVETAELRRVYGEGSTGKGLNKGLVRGGAGALKELETMQKSRATRIKRDSLDLALLELMAFYRDVLAVQFGASVELANEDRRHEVEAVARASSPEDTLRRTDAIMKCRERLAANVHPQIAVEAMTLALRSPGVVHRG